MITLLFNTFGNDKQKEAVRKWADKTTTSICYGGSKGSGKSFLGVSLIFSDALTYPNTSYFIARRQLNDLRKFTTPSIMEVFGKWGLTSHYYKFNGMDSFYDLYNGSRVYFIEASSRPEDPLAQRFGSLQFTRGWIEEAGEIDVHVKNALQVTIGRKKNVEYNLPAKLLMTCNPSHNFLYHEYYKPHRDGILPKSRAFIQALPTDNKMLGEQYLNNLRETLTGGERKRLLEGQWEYDSDVNLLVSYDAVSDIFNNLYVQPDEKDKVLSADIALQGRDKFVAFLWKGDVAVLGAVKNKADAKEVQEVIEELGRKNTVFTSRIVADADGLGAYLGAYIKGITLFHANQRANDPKLYGNLKTECAFALARAINERRLRITCNDTATRELISEELMQLRVKDITSDGKKYLIAKDDMKTALGRSPDFLDALLMRYYFKVKKAGYGITVKGLGYYD